MQQIRLIKKSWLVLKDINPVVIADLFYSKLFSQNPGLRKMFPKNMEHQYNQLMDMLTTIIIRLDTINELKGDFAPLAKRHIGYGVKPAHYKLVGEALLWTLQKGIGKGWTTEVADAWAACYTTLAEMMMSAATES